jgi:hypothetical protein
VKRKRALLESNPPGIAGRVATNIRPGELKNSPPTPQSPFPIKRGFSMNIWSFPHALKKLSPLPRRFKYLNIIDLMRKKKYN